MHFNKALFYFTLEALILLAFISVGLFVLGFILNWTSSKFRSNISAVIGPKAFVILFGPGIMIHELSHLLAAWLFFYKIEDVRFLDISGKNGSHGHVTASPRPAPNFWLLYIPKLWQAMGNLFIGIAPLVIGPALLLTYFYFVIPGGRAFLHDPSFHGLPSWGWHFGIWLYLLFATIFNVELSSADLKGTWHGFAFVVLAVALVALVSAQVKPQLLTNGVPRRYWASVGLGKVADFNAKLRNTKNSTTPSQQQ
ncbi:hypothetical protein [Bdellovibrio sp. NC01]|uniref:hypothetical protein n=1 Tax=Bdellovibrio sp. NC01 TaxID=2220073 RepID=UPI001157C092|nr:hypothetical protein [Bdellovibrio sp. NC01]QDK38194.1 hypothetical protein DOE51_11670 [Bdellovibrio sp. NC01]